MGKTAFDPSYILAGGTGGSNSTQDFRLTLVSNTPVMTTEVLAATTLYLTPYVGNRIALYNGSTWSLLESEEISLSLAGLAADTNYDVFVYNNSGNLALETAVWSGSWAGVSTRATALVYQNGVLVKSGELTRRYLGTIRTSAAGETEFSFGGTAPSGVEAKLFVWNYHNQVLTKAFSGSSSVGWTYTASGQGSFRAANGSNTMRISFVVGLREKAISADYNISAQVPTHDRTVMCGIGLNTVDDSIGTLFCGNSTNALSLYGSMPVGINAKCNTVCPEGFNFVQALDGGNQNVIFSFQCKDVNWGEEGPGLTFIGLF